MLADNAFLKFQRVKEAEQDKVEAKLIGTKKRGRPRKRKDATPVNILLAYADKVMLMELAEEECLGMNDLVTMWIRREYKIKEKRRILERKTKPSATKLE